MDVDKKKICLRCYFLYAQRRKYVTNEERSVLYKECLDLAQELDDKQIQMLACGALGDLNIASARLTDAIKYLEICQKISRQIGDKENEGHAHTSLGNCYHSLGRYDKAVHHHELSLDIARLVRNTAAEGHIYGSLGNCYCALAEYSKAISHHKKHLNIAKQTGDKDSEGRAYCNIGVCYQFLGQYNEAIHQYEMGLVIAKQIGDKTSEGRMYGNLGSCYNALGQCDKAMHHHELRLNIARQEGNKAGEGCAYGNIGNCYYSLGEYDKAIQYYERALNIAQRIGNKANEGGAHGSLGNCYYDLGQYDKAIHHHEMCLSIATKIGNKVDEKMSLCNLGNCYLSLGQYEKALHHHKMSLDIARKVGNKAGMGSAYGNIGSCYEALGQYEKAIEHHTKHLDSAKETGDKAGEGTAYANLGICHRYLGEYDKAIDYLEKNLNIANQIGDKKSEARTYSNLGTCYGFLGQCEKAVHYHEMFLNIAKQIGDKEGEGIACSDLGICHHVLGQYDKAERNLKESLPCFEELFENTPKQDQLKISIREIFVRVYEHLAIILLYQNKTEEALVAAERGRARALADLMQTSYSTQCSEVKEARILDLCDIRAVVKALGTSVLFLSLSIEGICMWVIRPDGHVEFRKHCFQMSTKTNMLDLLIHPTAFVEGKLKSLISRARTTHGQGFNCEDRSLSFLYAEEVVQQATASAQKTEERNIEELEDDEEKSTESNPLQELYQVVLQPVRQFMKGPQVVVVADGVLNLVPFHALVDENNRYVAESLQVRLIPSLATAKMILERPQEPQSQTTPLIIGDPDTIFAHGLQGAYQEAQLVGRLFGVKPFTRKDATKENFLKNVENANLIHIAAHGDMKRGEILLASKPGIDKKTAKKEDYMLLMSDIENKDLKAKLVVLSCCHSARGEVKAEGVIGIARAFIGAGVRAVLVALWAIDDKATLYFMEKFYEQLIRGKRASEALGKAMKAMRDTCRVREIRRWAPFVLIGDNVSLV